jgi:molybdenum cofactor cytidylyltransferase
VRDAGRAVRLQTLLLAAGRSRRFGADKLAAPLADGTPVVVRTARSLCAAGHPVLAVVRSEGSAVAALLAAVPDIVLSPCPDADLGIGRSLAWGVARSADAGGWLVCLGDMPFVRPETLSRVADALRAGASIAAPVHAGRRGHPVGFARCWREALLALDGDTGGQVILRAHPEALTLVPVDDPGVLRDLDLPEDLSPG